MNKTISKAENASAQPKIGTGIQSATGTKPQSEPRVPAPCTGTQSDPKSDPVAAKGCGFAFEINVEGDLHIHNHCASETAPIPPINEPVPCCAPIGDGNTCLPPIAGRKHKASPAQKFTKLAARNRVPSVLAAGAMHLVRRFLADVSPANPLEQAAFARLAQAPQALRQTLACAVAQVDGLGEKLRGNLFDTRILGLSTDAALDPVQLNKMFGAEIVQRAGIAAFGEENVEERPGKTRVYEPVGEDFFYQVRICSVNGLRSGDFIPMVEPGAYRPEEIAKDCVITMVNGEPKVNCQVRTGDCLGGKSTGGECLTVPSVLAGDGILLEGVNFFSVNAKVLLRARLPAVGEFELDCFVVGDQDTPVNETVNGKPRLINDCRVHDRISVTLPADLPPALYYLSVSVPNTTGLASLPPRLESNSVVIEVLPAVTARFQITAEKLHCRGETSPASFGSDEVGLRFLAITLNPDFSIGVQGEPETIRFGDVDSGDSRNIDRIMFQQTVPMAGVALLVLGHEVDGEDAYNNMVTSVTDIFFDLVKTQMKFIGGALSAAGIGAAALKALATWQIVVASIAVGVTLAIDLIIAAWAPADLIIEDPNGYSLGDLAQLTSPNFDFPPKLHFTTVGGIVVDTTPLEKLATQYKEKRNYYSEDESSAYEIFYRVNRLA